MNSSTEPFITWKPAFETGVPSIDLEHREFVDLLNELHAAVVRRDAAARALQWRVVELAADHFQHEEELYGASRYPGAAEHRAEHAWFMKRVQSDLGTDVHLVFAWLGEWLVQHVLGADREAATWVARAEAPAPLARVA